MARFMRAIHVFKVYAQQKMSLGNMVKPVPDIWQAIAKNEAEADTMRLRADLAIALRDRVTAWKVTQAEASKRLGISQSRLNELLKGRIENFHLDMLTRLASTAGLKVETKV